MAKFTDVNNLVANGSEALYILKETLKLAGWVVKSSSDGTTYNASADQITLAGSGAGGMDNSRAWYRIQDPGTKREFTVQRGTAETGLRYKYSALAKFTGGSPAATVTPTATDEQILSGAGTDASPTFTAIFTTAGTYYWHVVAQSTAENGVYGFWAYALIQTTGVTSGVILCEPLGSSYASALDQDPCYLIATAATITALSISHATAGSNVGKAWFKFNLSGATFTFIVAGTYTASNVLTSTFAGSLGTNSYDAGDNGIPMFFFRPSGFTTQVGMKGYSRFMFWKLASRSYPDTVNLNSDAYVYVNDVLLPWENGTTPSL